MELEGDYMRISKKMYSLGTETAFEVLARAEALKEGGRDIINLGIGQPDFSPPEHVVEAGIKALKDGHHGYTPAPGIPLLREAVSAYIAEYRNVWIEPTNVLITPGGKPTMFFAVMMFGEPGVEILYPNPGFPIYESAIKFSGARPIPMALSEKRNFSFSADAVLAQVTSSTRLIILNSPANPTGGATPKKEIDKLVDGLLEYPNVAVLSDEIYSRIYYDGEDHVSLLSYPQIRDRLIILDGWSKTYAMTGWRIGFSIWPDSLIDKAIRLAVNCHSCVNASAQWAGMAALQGSQHEVIRMITAFEERRTFIVDALNRLPGVVCRKPKGAFYVFPNVSGTGKRSQQLQRELLEVSGVAVIAGTSFGNFGEGFLRFSYANSLDNIRRAVERIEAYL